MYKIVFHCRSITPLMIHGADNQSFELRPSSFKGMMRFWWRAVAPNIVGDENLSKLRELENRYFGGAGETSKRSPVTVRTKQNEPPDLKKFDPKKGSLRYLFYGVEGSIQYPQTFKVILTGWDKKALRIASYAFWFLANLGGIGAKSRRGGGNIIVDDVKDSDGILDSKIPFSMNQASENSSDLTSYLKDNVPKVRSLILEEMNIQLDVVDDPVKTYSHLSAAELYIYPKSFDQSDKALSCLQTWWQDFRSKDLRKEDKSIVERYINNEKFHGTVQRSGLGLPLSIKRSAKWVKVAGSVHTRRASPFCFRILEENEEKYWVILLHFSSDLLAPGEELKLYGPRGKESPPLTFPDGDKLVEFFKEKNGLAKVDIGI